MTGAVARVGLAWRMRPELSPRRGGAKPLPGGGPSSMGAGLPQWRATSRPPDPGGPGPSPIARLGVRIKDSRQWPQNSH